MKAHATRRLAGLLIAALAMLSCLPAASAAEGPRPSKSAEIRSQGIHVIPRPAQIEAGEGRFSLTAQTTIRVSADTERMGRYLAGVLAPATGYQLTVATEASGNGRAGASELSLSGDTGRLGDEGYELQVLADRVLITAAKPAGVFYGCQTLRQLFPGQIEGRTNNIYYGLTLTRSLHTLRLPACCQTGSEDTMRP
ncbi:MAG: glycoside hydrolase family 20 zincin-like fold domain-containing protein [Verrucomicrobiota bacterium]